MAFASSSFTFAASVGDALLTQFKEYAKQAVDKGDLVSDPAYEKVLQGLKVAAPQAGAAVLEQLLLWRGDTLTDVGASRASPDSSLVLRKRLVAEGLFLEATLALLGADAAVLAPQQTRELEHLAFDWILHAEKYVDHRYPELYLQRERVILASSQMLGCLSPVALDSITERFLKELGARIKADPGSPSRQELYLLCSGLRFLRLHADTPSQLRAATNFLERVHPLKHVAPDKKSRLQHAITDMMTSVLAPLADSGNPSNFGRGCDEELRKHWFSTVAYLRAELLRWTGKQSKQALSGLPAVAVLTCLECEDNLVASIDALIEQLHRQLKDKRNASMALMCLVRCVSCFLRRLSERSDRDRLTKWVARSVAPAVQGMARGQLPAPEHQDLLRQLCTVVTHQLPEYGLGGMVLELLAADGAQAWEAPMTGLLSLMSILADAPARLAARPPALDLPPTAAAMEQALASGGMAGWAPPVDASLQLLDIVKAGHNPLEAYAVPHLLPNVAAALGRLLGQCHQLHGYSRLTNAARPAPDGPTRERLSALPVFVAVLQCLPYVMPDVWPSGGGPAEDLPGYTIHAEPSVRQAASAALHRSMVAMPAARDALVAGMATFVVRLPDEFPRVIKDSIGLLLATMAEWDCLAAVEAAAAAAAGDPSPSPSLSGAFNSVARVEGAALGLLCSADVDTRRLGVEVMRTARDLHRSLTARCATAGFGFGFGSSSRRATAAGGGGQEAPPPPQQQQQQLGLPPHAISRRSGGPSGGTILAAAGAAAATPGPGSIHHARRTSGLAGLPPLSFSPASSVAEAAAAATSVPSTPGSVGDGGGSVLYLADIVERLGAAIVQRCFWDFGRWSDLWREWRPVPPDGSTFSECLGSASTPEDGVRWARVLCELAREAWRRCEKAAWAAHLETTAKLQALLALDSTGRQVLPHDGARAELARMYCLLAAAAPLMDSAQVAERSMHSRDLVRLLVSSARAGVDSLQLTAVLGLGCADPSCHMLVAQEAQVLAEDFSGGGARGGMPMGRGRVKKDDARLVHAHVLRVLSSNLAPGALLRATPLRERLIEFVADTARHIATTAEVSTELQQLRYCLCVVARQTAAQLAESSPQIFPPMFRKQLFDKFSLFCEEGQTPGLFRSELRRSIAAAKVKVKDSDQGKALEADIADASETLEHAAYLGMAAMLQGSLFDADAGEPNGRVLSWVDRMLAAAGRQQAAAAARLGGRGLLAAVSGGSGWGPPKEHCARLALRNLLRSNAELAHVFVDRCYAPAPQLASAYFLVLTDVYSSVPLALEQHVVVGLVLHKVVDVRPALRDAARGMLGTLARRCWSQDLRRSTLGLGSTPAATPGGAGPDTSHHSGGGGNGGSVGESSSEEAVNGAVVVGSLAESQHAYQQHLSTRLARDHAELSQAVALEVLSRHQGGIAAGAEALLCLPPWLEYAVLGGPWEGQWGGALLRSLYRTTALQGARRAYPVQKLWTTIASNRRNIAPTLDFLLKQGLVESTAVAGVDAAAAAPLGAAPSSTSPCAVGKQVALYLSRVAPRPTIDLLVHEALQQMAEADPLAPGRQRRASQGALATPGPPRQSRGGGGGDWSMIREFHHQPAAAPPQQPLPRQPLAAHAAAAVAAATSAADSKPLTPSSIALAIKRSTLDLIIKTGVAVADTVAVAGAAAVGTISASGLTTPSSAPRMPTASERAARFSTPAPDPAAAAYTLPSPRRRPQSPPEPPPPQPPPRTQLTRPELALCLLSEIACERDEELRPHLAPLLHVAVLHADSANPLVRLEACQLLQYLLYSLACKQLESQAQGQSSPAGDYARVSGVIGYLQSLGGEALWPCEQPTLTQPWVPSAGYVAAFVQLVVDCFYFDSALREKWSAEALKWACCAASRHAASRSHQVYCALGPALTSSSCTALLASLQKCLQNATAEGLDTAVELLCTLRVVLANTPPRKLLLYPHLFAACVALLNSSVVRVGELAAALLMQLLEAVDLSTAAAQQAVLCVLPLEEEESGGERGGALLARSRSSGGRLNELASTPGQQPRRRPSLLNGSGSGGFDAAQGCWPFGHGLLGGTPDVDDDLAGGPWLALQQLLVKGLFQPDTEALALEALAAVAQQIGRAGAAGRLGPRANGAGLTAALAGGRCFTAATLDQMLAAGGPGGKGSGATGIEAVLGSAEVGLAISLSAVLPWLCVHVGGGELADACAAFLQASAGACAAVGWGDLSFVLAALAAGPPPAPSGFTGAAAWLPDLSEVVCRALFPAYSRLVIQRLMEAVQHGTERYQAAALACLKTIFAVPGLDLGSPAWFAEGSRLVELLSGEVGGPLGPRVLEVLQAMAAFKDDVRGAPQWGEPSQLEWRHCLDPLGECNKVCSEALRRVVAACPGSAELSRAASGRPGSSAAAESPGEQLLPFLPHNWN